VHERYRRQTDDRRQTTDGRAIAYSEREHEFTFAKKGHTLPLPTIFGPYLSWPNGWMDQYATWYKDRPLPIRRAAPQKQGGGTAVPHFSAHVYCGQTAGCIKMLLGTAVDLGPGHIVLDGNPAKVGSC